jgi:hypothetical protein
MDPSTEMVAAIMYPSALEAKYIETNKKADVSIPWSDSLTNPKNRIDSLSPMKHPKWRIDGGEVDGTRYFALPSFTLRKPPLRIDTYIPDTSLYSESLRAIMQPQSTMFTSSSRISFLPISNYVLRALEIWSNRQPDLESVYMNMPFGSRIIFDTITSDIRTLDIHILPNFDIERRWLSVKTLQDLWNLPCSSWPAQIDLEELELIQQPHEAISIVEIPKTHGATPFVFKSVLRDIEYFYHELKILLTLEPHRNIISRPSYVVTKRCRFGGKIGVCGFILQYHRSGTLQNALLHLPKDLDVRLKTQLRWAKQLTSAIQHIHESPIKFYSNLKLINVVMRATNTGTDSDAILIDFEQRNGHFSWSAPEIHYIHYLEHLATFSASSETRSRYTGMLQIYIPSWKPLNSKTRYNNPEHGFSFPWLVLTEEEQESAQVFMLGKLLWCIFEGASGISSAITVETFREEPCEIMFPTFSRTPPSLRGFIRRCTAGAPEWEGRWPGVARRDNKLYPLGKTGVGGGPLGTLKETQEAAKRWWSNEIKAAEKFLDARSRLKLGIPMEEGSLKTVAFMEQRPTLMEVKAALEGV